MSLPAPLPVLEGARVTLRKFDTAQISARYVGWLNDAEVNRFSRRGGRVTSEAEARAYIASRTADEAVFGIHTPAEGHVGNLKLGPVDWDNRRADISIVIGEKRVWGRGLAAESIYLATRFAFEQLQLNRIDAGSGNPAFIKAVRNLGWTLEGVLRERVLLESGFVDWSVLAILRREFRRLPRYERAGT